MTGKLSLGCALAALVAVSTPIFAHHGNAAYDETKEVTLKGIVTEFDWVNPHSQIYFDVMGSKGGVVHWGCETLSPGKLMRSGWSRDALKPGDQVTIKLVAARNGAPVGLLHKVVFAGGRTLSAEDVP